MHELLRRHDVPLVTLTGPGGVSKTRLALRLAPDLDAVFPDGSVVVEFSPMRDPALVPAMIARTFAIHDGERAHLLDRLVAVLGPRTMLVLDNCKQMLETVLFITRLLASCPGMTVLATSRDPLRLTEERIAVVPPFVDSDPAAEIDEISESPAVRLFVARAEAGAVVRERCLA